MISVTAPAQRKYTAFLLAFFMASVFLAFDKLTGGEWVGFVGGVYAAFMAGNVGEHFSKRGADNVVA